MTSSKQIAILEAMIVVLEEEFRHKKAELSDPNTPICEIQDAHRKHIDEVNALKEKIFTLTPENELMDTLAQLNGMADGTIPTNWGPNPDFGSIWAQQSLISSELTRRKMARTKIIIIFAAAISLLLFLKEYA